MKRNWILLFVFSVSVTVFGQNETTEYTTWIKKGDSLYDKKDYKASASAYSTAFRKNTWNAAMPDRYNAACSWALAGFTDSAFFQLDRAANVGGYSNYGHITTDTDLMTLHNDPRWQSLLEVIKQNKAKAEVNYNQPLVHQLDSIYVDDQKYRQMIGGIEKKFGWESPEMKDLWKIISKKDSIDLIQVTKILDQYGWLGPDVIGGQGNVTLFLVIQHSDQKTQEKYLPMMRSAVKNGKAQGSNLALLEDRIALAQGKKQIYGSQIHKDNKTGKYFVAPIEDEANVNKRRVKVGLGPLEEYARQWDIDYKLPVK